MYDKCLSPMRGGGGGVVAFDIVTIVVPPTR